MGATIRHADCEFAKRYRRLPGVYWIPMPTGKKLVVGRRHSFCTPAAVKMPIDGVQKNGNRVSWKFASKVF